MLIGTAGHFTGHSFEVTQAGLRIGRDPGNELYLPDNDVSRFHARVVLHNGAVWVQDAGSRNGVFVNDSRIPEHKTLGVGDELAVGKHRFTVEMQDADNEHSVSVNLEGIAEPKKKGGWKIWPFAVALGIVVVFVAIIALAGNSGGEPTGEAEADAPKYGLAAAMKKGDEQPADGPNLEEALAVASGSPLTKQDEWPDPPEGATAAELVEMGHKHYNAGRLPQAVEQYQMGLKLDKDCEICAIRIERLTIEIDEKIAENFDAGMRYFDALQYQQAVNAWETVLLLEPDETSAIHQQTREYLDEAKAKIARQY